MLTKYNTNKNISFSWKGKTFNQVTSLIKKNLYRLIIIQIK